MGFRLVPKSVTLNDREQRNGCVVCVISLSSVAFLPNYVKMLISQQQIFSGEMSSSRPTKHDGHAVLFVVVQLFVTNSGKLRSWRGMF